MLGASVVKVNPIERRPTNPFKSVKGGAQHEVNVSFPGRASFHWAFIFRKWKSDKRRVRNLPVGYTPTLSVVLPALNEVENLPRVLPLIPVWVDEVLLVDGQPTDGTIEVVQQLLPGIRVVLQEGRGKGGTG